MYEDKVFETRKNLRWTILMITSAIGIWAVGIFVMAPLLALEY